MAQRHVQTLIIFFAFMMVFINFTPHVLAKETVKVMGDNMTYSVTDNLLVVTGNAVVITEDATIKANELQAIYKNGQVIEIKALGQVELVKKDDTFFSTELTYHIKNKTGLILNIEAHASIEDSKEKAYLFGKTANYTAKMIEITDGSMTTCNEKKPHYLFKAKRVEFYPDDKIRAWHLTFWEFNGKVPLLYFPYYTFSLKEEEREFTPSVGYSVLTGLFLKMVYRYYEPRDQHGELYLDLYQKLGPGAGVKHFYLDTKNHTGSVYVYFQKQDSAQTIPYLTAKHSHRSNWNDWTLTSNTTLLRYGIRDSLTNVNSFGYQKGTNLLKWDSNYTASYLRASDMGTYYLKNSLRMRWDLAGVRLEGDFDDDHYLLQPNGNLWQGTFKAYQIKPFYDWTLTFNKKGNRDTRQNLYTLPELDLRLKFGALKTNLKPIISPFSYNLQAGWYRENRSQQDAYRLVNKLTFSKDMKLFKPFSLGLTATGLQRVYSTGDIFYQVNPSIELRTQTFYGFTGNIKYAYSAAEGSSPFNFDRLSTITTEQLTMNLNYYQKGFRLSSSTGYNLRLERFDNLNNTLSYTWGNNSNIQLTVPYNIELKKFNEISGSIKVKGKELDLNLASRLNPQSWKFNRLETNLDWQINNKWHLKLVTAFNPERGFNLKDYSTKGQIEITRNLHCRELSVSYDAVQKEIWFRYQITAFPKQKVRLGSNPNDPILFDMDLGGTTNGQ